MQFSLGTGDQLISACANSTSAICFTTAISGQNVVTGLWFNALLGLLCFILFVIFRAKFSFYQARLELAQVTHKPPAMRMDGHHRIWCESHWGAGGGKAGGCVAAAASRQRQQFCTGPG